MKIYSCPKEVPVPVIGYSDRDWQTKEAKHSADLAEYLKKVGYTGKYTGKIYREGVADGYALYMMADAGAKSVLIHLPYGDAYQARDVNYVPRAEIIRRIEADESFAALFSKKA